MAKSYDLTILSQKFTLKSDDDEVHVKKVADYVNKKMHEIVSHNKAISTSNIAMLAALNIADDFFKTQKKQAEKTQNWVNRVEALIDQVEKM